MRHEILSLEPFDGIKLFNLTSNNIYFTNQNVITLKNFISFNSYGIYDFDFEIIIYGLDYTYNIKSDREKIMAIK